MNTRNDQIMKDTREAAERAACLDRVAARVVEITNEYKMTSTEFRRRIVDELMVWSYLAFLIDPSGTLPMDSGELVLLEKKDISLRAKKLLDAQASSENPS